MRLERSTYPQVEAYLEGNDTVLMLFGSTEQHGKHNPLGTDSFAPQKLSELIEKDLPGLLIAPILPFGSSPRFVEFPGTFNLGDQLYLAVVKKLCENLYDQGFRHFVFLNGHGGNSKALTECQLDLAKKGCRAALLNWWSMVADFNPEWAGGHGGGQETSANLYIDPTMVDLDSVESMGLINDLGDDMPSVHFDTVKYKGVSVTVPRPTNYYAENGWIGPDDPKKASAEWGREMLETVAAWMVDFIQAFSKTPLPDSED